MTTLALAHGVVLELLPDAQPSLVVPHLNYRVPIGSFDAAVLCSMVADPVPAGSSDISPELFSLLASSGTVVSHPSSDAPPSGAGSLTLSDWAVLHACQYEPPAAAEVAALLQIRDDNAADVRIAPLPHPIQPPSISLWEAIRRRRSVRRGPTRDLPLATLSTLLAYTGRTEASACDQYGAISYRPTASAGARHPVDIYVMALRVDSLADGIYLYDPYDHALRSVVTSTALVTRLVPLLCRALTSDADCVPALVFLFDLVVDRTAAKYRAAAGGLLLRDLGCVVQQMHLVMTGLDLVGCAIGRLPSALTERILRLDLERHIVLGGFAVW